MGETQAFCLTHTILRVQRGFDVHRQAAQSIGNRPNVTSESPGLKLKCAFR